MEVEKLKEGKEERALSRKNVSEEKEQWRKIIFNIENYKVGRSENWPGRIKFLHEAESSFYKR